MFRKLSTRPGIPIRSCYYDVADDEFARVVESTPQEGTVQWRYTDRSSLYVTVSCRCAQRSSLHSADSGHRGRGSGNVRWDPEPLWALWQRGKSSYLAGVELKIPTLKLH
jgi:hypothetical protein